MLHADHTADSLIPQRLNRIQPGGFGGGVVAGHHAYAKAEDEAGEDPFPGNDKARLQQERHAVPDQQAQHDPEDAAHLADDHRFGQELTADQLRRRAQGFSDPDFPRALRHRYEHDVHQPDGRAEQGDETDDRGGNSDRADLREQEVGDAVTLRDLEVVLLFDANTTDGPEESRRFAHRHLEVGDVVHADVDRERHVRPGEVGFHIRNGQDADLVAAKSHRGSLFFQHPDDAVLVVAYRDHLVERVRTRKDLFHQVIPDDRDVRAVLHFLRREIPPGCDGVAAGLQIVFVPAHHQDVGVRFLVTEFHGRSTRCHRRNGNGRRKIRLVHETRGFTIRDGPKTLRSFARVADADVHPAVLDGERIGAHVRKVRVDRSFDRLDRGQDPDQRHDTDRDDQGRQYRP